MNPQYYARRKQQLEDTARKRHMAMVASGNRADKKTAFTSAFVALMDFTKDERKARREILDVSLLTKKDGKERCPLCETELQATDFQDDDGLRLMTCSSCKFTIHVGTQEDLDATATTNNDRLPVEPQQD